MKKNKAAYLMMILSTLIFGTIGIVRKNISLSSALIAFARGLIGSAVLFPVYFLKTKKPFPNLMKKSGRMMALSGALIGLNWMFLFEAFELTTVPVATLCYYMEPTIVILLSPLFFREKLSGRKLLCAAAAVIGMVLVSGIGSSGGTAPGSLKGILLALGASVLYSGVVILNKKFPTEDIYERTVVQLFSASLIMIPYLIFSGQLASFSPSGSSLLLLLVMGAVHTGFAYALFFSAVQSLPAQSVAILSYIDPVSALLLSALFLEEKLTVFGAVGAVLIIGSAILSELAVFSSPEKTAALPERSCEKD